MEKYYGYLIALVIAVICLYQTNVLLKKDTAIFNSYTTSFRLYSTPTIYKYPAVGTKMVSGVPVKYSVVGGKIYPSTVLTPEQMRIQFTDGCTACH